MDASLRLVEDLPPHVVPVLFQHYRPHRILHSWMTCAVTLLGSVPISAKRPVEAGGCRNFTDPGLHGACSWAHGTLRDRS